VILDGAVTTSINVALKLIIVDISVSKERATFMFKVDPEDEVTIFFRNFA
jgi:hypothetical protein